MRGSNHCLQVGLVLRRVEAVEPCELIIPTSLPPHPSGAICLLLPVAPSSILFFSLVAATLCNVSVACLCARAREGLVAPMTRLCTQHATSRWRRNARCNNANYRGMTNCESPGVERQMRARVLKRYADQVKIRADAIASCVVKAKVKSLGGVANARVYLQNECIERNVL